MGNRPKFIVDQNVGKLAKLLRLLGYDTIFFSGETDTQMVDIALAEKRQLLTRDTHILERRVAVDGQVKVVLLNSDDIEKQIRQVVTDLHLEDFQPFTLCLEDNQPLIARTREEVKDKVPPYVWQTQSEYVECPHCHRIYWKGTHWDAMTRRFEKLVLDTQKEKPWNPQKTTAS
jgi:uncharacterized protein with PIN domain